MLTKSWVFWCQQLHNILPKTAHSHLTKSQNNLNTPVCICVGIYLEWKLCPCRNTKRMTKMSPACGPQNIYIHIYSGLDGSFIKTNNAWNIIKLHGTVQNSIWTINFYNGWADCEEGVENMLNEAKVHFAVQIKLSDNSWLQKIVTTCPLKRT